MVSPQHVQKTKEAKSKVQVHFLDFKKQQNALNRKGGMENRILFKQD